MSAAMIGESFEVRYRVILIPITWGSSAAWLMNSSTVVENRS